MGYRGKKARVSLPLSPKYLGRVNCQKRQYGTQKADVRWKAVEIAARNP